MINKLLGCALFVISAVALGCGQPDAAADPNDGLATFSKDSLIHHIKVLASDSFLGRRPFSEGETKTVDYLERTLAALGLEPGNGNSYVQEVPMVEITPICDPTMLVETGKGNFNLRNMEDYVIWTESTDSVVTLKNDDVVFAGYGVVAPEYNWNDYAGIDVKGKVVLVMVNDPGFNTGDTTMFKGKAMTYYGRWTYKFEEASRQGAKGCLIIHNTAAASYPFDVVRNSWGTSQMHLDNRGDKNYRIPVEGWITENAAKQLLLKGGQDTSVLVKANEKGFKPVALAAKLSTSMKVKSVFNTSKNIVAKIPGTKTPDEYIVYSAHWDHFGVGKPDEKGDSIYNGALDNGSGTAALLELARAFQSMKTKPERSILFLFVTAEEQGLLGSAYYAGHPIYPAAKTVANLNIDVINNMGKAKDIELTGGGQSELEDMLQQEAATKGRYVSPEAHPEAGHYFRSDHFNFAKIGIPALTTAGGTDHLEKGKSFGKAFADEYNEKLYHRPSDEYDPQRWNLDGGMEDIQLFFQIGKKLAFGNLWPKWKEGSEFRAIREKDKK